MYHHCICENTAICFSIHACTGLCRVIYIYSRWWCVQWLFVLRLPKHAAGKHTLDYFARSIFLFNEKSLNMNRSCQWCDKDGRKQKQQRKKKTNSLRKRLTFTEARMQLNFCWRILCILLPEAKKGSMAGCSAKRGSRKKDMCVLGRNAASGLTFWLSF